MLERQKLHLLPGRTLRTRSTLAARVKAFEKFLTLMFEDAGPIAIAVGTFETRPLPC